MHRDGERDQVGFEVEGPPTGRIAICTAILAVGAITGVAPVALAAAIIAGTAYLVAAERQRLKRQRDGARTYAATIAERFDLAQQQVDREQEFLTHLALHDGLTGLPNRVLLLDRLSQARARCIRKGQRLAVLFVDLDRFKDVNDTHGHDAGDEVLRTSAKRLLAAIRPEDTAARIGGDEFVVVCEHVDDEPTAERIAERIGSMIAAPTEIGGSTVVVTASIGMVLGDAHSSSDALLRDADLAMYGAKQDGRARHQFFSPMIGTRVAQRIALESELHQALLRDEIEIDYQPFVELASGDVAGVEALMRWRHPTRGRLYPESFLAVAEESGLIVALGRAVLEEAATTVAASGLIGNSAGPFSVSVNLSARQLAAPSLIVDVQRVLERSGLAPNQLCLELTERSLLGAPSALADDFRTLKDLGVEFALDDFGTGYASLSYLRHYPIDVIKIDRSFVAAMTDTDGDGSIVRAVVQIARNLDLKVVAEGIETAGELDAVRALGCQYGQGYFLGRPGPAVESMVLGRA